MKKILIVLFVFAFAGSLWCESVTEVAKREKERRAQLEKEGKKAKVLTNKDVPNIKSSLGIESTTPVPDQSGVTSTDETTAAIQQATQDANEDMEQLKQKRDELTGKAQEIQAGIDQSPNASDIGSRFQQKRLTEEELKKVDDQIRAIEEQRKKAAEQKGQEQDQTPPEQDQEEPQSQPQNYYFDERDEARPDEFFMRPIRRSMPSRIVSGCGGQPGT